MNIVKRALISLRYRINRWLDAPDQMERLEMNGLRYGKNFHLYNSFIDEGHAFLVEIGDDVTITNSTILAHDASTKLDLNYSRVGGVTIGNRVFIGYGTIVLPNVKIGNDVIIGAGSVVTKDVPDDSVAVGNPAKVIGKKSEYIERNRAFLNVKPTFHTYFPQKTLEEKAQMIKELRDSDGFDP